MEIASNAVFLMPAALAVYKRWWLGLMFYLTIMVHSVLYHAEINIRSLDFYPRHLYKLKQP